jgi:hypothetical protein
MCRPYLILGNVKSFMKKGEKNSHRGHRVFIFSLCPLWQKLILWHYNMNEKSLKHKIFKLSKWMFFVVIFLSSTAILAPQSDDVITSIIRQLAARLDLTEDQADKIKSIISAAEDQMTRDRDMFKGNEPALIETAKKRQDMTEMHIEAVLNPEQQKKYPEFKTIIHLDDQVISLMEILAMTYPQAYKTAAVMEMEKKQAQLDRETYKKSALALISAATARKEMADTQIRDFLNPHQQQKFYVFKQGRDADIEFFELKEGLILDREQTVKVEQILKEFREKTKEDMKKRGSRIGMGMPGRGGGMRGGGMGGGRGGMMGGGMGGHGRGRGGPGPNNDMMEKMKEHEEKKTTAIIKILAPEQIERYNQILEKRKQEIETRMNQIMEKRR